MLSVSIVFDAIRRYVSVMMGVDRCRYVKEETKKWIMGSPTATILWDRSAARLSYLILLRFSSFPRQDGSRRLSLVGQTRPGYPSNRYEKG